MPVALGFFMTVSKIVPAFKKSIQNIEETKAGNEYLIKISFLSIFTEFFLRNPLILSKNIAKKEVPKPIKGPNKPNPRTIRVTVKNNLIKLPHKSDEKIFFMF